MQAERGLFPRLYQNAVFEESLQRNIVARIDTGGGKTLCAILFIKHIASQLRIASPDDQHSLIVFIVPTVSLVHQQAEVVRTQTTLRVREYVGSMGVDFWERQKWLDEFYEADVVVATAQVWLNCLIHAYWPLSKVSLMIFDECHHAMSNHPYAVIMKEHYHRAKTDATAIPRILGLTASPVWNPKNPTSSIATLESILDCRVYEVEPDPSMRKAAPKPHERLVEFYPPLPFHALTVNERLVRSLDEIEVKDKTLESMAITKLEIGELGSDLRIQEMISTKINALKFMATQSLRDALEVVTAKIERTIIDIDSISPKVQALLDVLAQEKARHRRGVELRAIVFVQRRQHAMVLSRIVEKATETKAWIKSGFLVGHGSQGLGDADDAKMASNQQRAKVEAFRTGEFNVIFCTSVAEEGLDFSLCNTVVRFDPLQTITGYIQSRGRARSPDSAFIVLAERETDEAERYYTYVSQEPELQEIYGDRPTDEPDEPTESNLPTFIVQSTGAILTHSSAISLLFELCSLLRHDEFSDAKPVFTEKAAGTGFQATVKLPMIPCLDGERLFEGGTLQTKQGAKQNAAFNALLRLYDLKALDEHLLPNRESSKGANAHDVDGNLVDRTPLKGLLESTFKNPCGNPRDARSELWLHRVQIGEGIDGYTIGLIAGENFGSFVKANLFASPTERLLVRLLAVERLEWTGDERAERMEKLDEFNRRITTIMLNRRIDTTEFFSFWTPLLPDGSLDWPLLDTAFLPADPASLTPSSIMVILARSSSQHFFRFVEHRVELDSDVSTTMEIVGDPRSPGSAQKLFAKYPLYAQYVQVKHGHEIIPGDPLLAVESLDDRILNHLRPMESDISAYDARARTFPASFLRLTNLPLAFFTAIRRSPSVLRTILDHVRAAEFLEHYDLPKFPCIVALTPTAAGTGFDFQSLETLGDSFLKLAVTINAYMSYPTYEEGRLSTLRQNSLDNRYLLKTALKINLGQFSLSDKFKLSGWLPPPNIEAISSKKPDEKKESTFSEDKLSITRMVGGKALADTMESLLGASFSEGGIAMALQVGHRLGLAFGGEVSWRERFEKLHGGKEQERWMVPPNLVGLVEKLEEVGGYRVRNPRLFVQAITHRSYQLGATSYEREEFLGDALLDFFITSYLFKIFPDATNSSVTFIRAQLVSNSTLAFLAIRVLGMHAILLHSSSDLQRAIMLAAKQMEGIGYEAILQDMTWMTSPPKQLGDVVESLLGSILVDSGYDLEAVFGVLERLIYKDVIPHLVNVERRDPISMLNRRKQEIHCSALEVKAKRDPETKLIEAICTFHDRIIATATHDQSVHVARQLASRSALLYLATEGGIEEIKNVCDCWEIVQRKSKAAKVKAEESLWKELEEIALATEEMNVDEVVVENVGEDAVLEERDSRGSSEVLAEMEQAEETGEGAR